MGWFDFAKSPAEAPIETLRIPLFPLGAVLFPGGRLPLNIFEPHYLDMAAACHRDDKPFGFCLIASGSEVGALAVPHPVGTLARVVRWEQAQRGILMITAQGGRRFRILERSAASGTLLEATVALTAEGGPTPFPPERKRLLPLLRRIVDDLGPERIPEPHRFDDAEWVGYRITEILPIQNLAKQKLLELDDPLSRLDILETFLDQRKLLV